MENTKKILSEYTAELINQNNSGAAERILFEDGDVLHNYDLQPRRVYAPGGKRPNVRVG